MRISSWTTLLALAWVTACAAAADYAPVVPGRGLSFPRDHGAHPEFRTEWWYVTGWLETGGGEALGFQVTFFRSRPNIGEGNPSRFAPNQLLFAHAALSDPRIGHLLHEQRSARAGFGLAEAERGDSKVHIADWSLQRGTDGRYQIRIKGQELQFELALRPTQPLLLQGDAGYSRKGPTASAASYYYSQPHLAVSGTVSHDGRSEEVKGQAWLDHEWSSEMLAQDAVGWDWIAINLDDGGALMAFRIRDGAGRALWTAASRRRGDGGKVAFAADAVSLVAQRRWRSPHTGVEYPVAMHIAVGELAFDLVPLQDDQELDARSSTGNVYWEGAVTAVAGGKPIGRGYMELTGYFRPLRL